jgi:hypothetical protein
MGPGPRRPAPPQPPRPPTRRRRRPPRASDLLFTAAAAASSGSESGSDGPSTGSEPADVQAGAAVATVAAAATAAAAAGDSRAASESGLRVGPGDCSDPGQWPGCCADNRDTDGGGHGRLGSRAGPAAESAPAVGGPEAAGVSARTRQDAQTRTGGGGGGSGGGEASAAEGGDGCALNLRLEQGAGVLEEGGDAPADDEACGMEEGYAPGWVRF